MSLPSSCEFAGALILAAGKGTRMYSQTPKVLQRILEEPMLGYVYHAAAPVFGDRVWTVVGHGADDVRTAFPEQAARCILQAEQMGTGHAVQVAWDILLAAGLERVLVINGDTPLLPETVLREFMDACLERDADVAFISLSLREPGAFGRVVRHGGHVAAIVEAKDYDIGIHGPVRGEVNAGIYCLKTASVGALLPRLTRENRGGELYITDLVGLAVNDGLQVLGFMQGDNPNLMGINTPAELVRSEELIRRRIVDDFLNDGVLIHNPGAVRIGPHARLERGAEITGPCELYGRTRVARGARIASHCRLNDVRVAENASIHSFCHLEKAEIGPSCVVGPFARLRPGAVMEEGAHVGNFVEMKKSRLGIGSKANHLTYLGDAEIGPGANIGAGTITCNYDGADKHPTIIGEGAFIGSNTALVAPVRIGEHSVVGAGSVITRDVPPRSLGLTRAPQRIRAWRKKRAGEGREKE